MTSSAVPRRGRLARAAWVLAWLVGAAGACDRAAPVAREPAAAGSGHASRLPARIRRLTNVEYERAVSEVVGATEHVADRLPPDVRQDGYTPNAEQAVPSAWHAAVDAVAREVAHRAVSERLAALAPCAEDETPACRADFVDRFGARAWRRPLEPGERASLAEAFDTAAAQAGGHGAFAAGAQVVLTALLESPSLLYLTELGSGGAAGTLVTLTPYEIASLLSFTIRGGPPDSTLLAAAATGALAGGAAREAQARRLLAMKDTRDNFRRFVLEWLEVDGLPRTAKNQEMYPDYARLQPHMLDETTAFADEVMVYAGGSVRGLLDARFASVDPDMARFYGLKTWGARASLAGTGRVGVLQQASFLAAHAHEDGTSPVKRGDFVLRRLLCIRVPRPAEVGIETVFPPPSKAKSTRERFDVHAQNPGCRTCHDRLDAIGFTFEGFDAVGSAQATDHGHAVDTRAKIDIGEQTLAFDDSRALSEWLAADPDVADCFARQAFRYFTGQADPKIETELVGLVPDRGGDRQDNLFESLLAYVRSDLFIQREVLP